MWSDFHAYALRSVFDALDNSDIRWMVLRNYEGLPQSNRSKDIDIALPREDLTRVKALISSVLRSCGFSHYENVAFQYADCNTYFAFHQGKVVSLKIDLLDGFGWRGAPLLTFDGLYARRISYSDFYVPSGVDDGFMLWIKPLLTGGFVKEKYVDDIQRAIEKFPSEFNQLIIETFGRKMSRIVWPLLQSGGLHSTVRYQPQLRSSAWLTSFIEQPSSTSIGFISHFIHEIFRRSCRRPGLFLSVAGPDGVGKTTFIESLKVELADILVKDEATITVEHFRPHILPNLKQLVSGKHYNSAEEEFHNPHRAKPAGTVSSFIRMTYYWLDYMLGYWLRTRRNMANGQTIIFDRYFYDFVVDPRRSRLSLPLWLRKLFLRLTPQPDLVFFLDCDAGTVFERKQELGSDEIDRQLGVYRQLTQNDPVRFVTLDARQPPEESTRKALVELVTRSFEKL